MTRRLPFGGNGPVTLLTLGLLGACLGTAWLLAGCSGDENDDDYYGSPYPRYHFVTIILNVSDLAGGALGQATVWVNGVAQDERTSWEFVTLGSDFPPSWRGFRANWIKGGFTVATYGYDDVARIKVMVSKPGYYTQETVFEVDDRQPAEVYARDTFIMQPAPYPTTAGVDKPRVKPTPGEVLGWEKKPTVRGPSMYKPA